LTLSYSTFFVNYAMSPVVTIITVRSVLQSVFFCYLQKELNSGVMISFVALEYGSLMKYEAGLN